MNIIDKHKFVEYLKLELQRFATSGSFTTTGYNGGGYPDRYIFSWNVQSQDITNNYTVISYSVVGSGGSTSGAYTYVKEKFVTIDGATQSNAVAQKTVNGTTPFSGTQVIYHNPDGSRNFSASCGGAFYNYGAYNSTGSGSWDLPTIPRASQPSMSSSDFNIGNTTTIYTNRASASFTHVITVAFGSFSRTFYSVGTSVDWNTLTDASSLFAQIPNANSGVGTINCDTYNGGTYIGTKSTSFTLRVTNSEPTFTDFTYLDENATTVAITGNNQVLIKNYSDVKVTCVPATPKNSATINSYKAQIGSKYVSGASNILDFGTFSVIDKLYATATDSRNLSTAINKQPIMINYSDIITSVVALIRQNGVDATVFLSLEGTISSILVNAVEKNSIQVAQYRYKKTTDAEYGTWQNVISQIAVSNGVFSVDDLIIGTAFDTDSSYNFQFYIKDKLSEETVTTQIVAGIPLNSYRTGKMGIMKVPTQGALDVGGDIYANNQKVATLLTSYPIGSIYHSNVNTNPSTLFGGTWVQERTYYGGELIAYGLVRTTGIGSSIPSGTNTSFSDTALGPKAYDVTNYIDGIITGTGGALYISTKGIVGMIEADMFVSGLGATGIRGFWWQGSGSTLPTGVSMVNVNSRNVLATGPIDANYGGNNNKYIYKIDSSNDLQFYVNPQFAPYNGAFTPSAGGVLCHLWAKVYAKYGTTYTWRRTA